MGRKTAVVLAVLIAVVALGQLLTNIASPSLAKDVVPAPKVIELDLSP